MKNDLKLLLFYQVLVMGLTQEGEGTLMDHPDSVSNEKLVASVKGNPLT
jgi:hypothetical protein